MRIDHKKSPKTPVTSIKHQKIGVSVLNICYIVT